MKISACIVAKNEELNLPRLLKSIDGLFHEIILVDTGSTDNTIEIARDYGCKVYKKDWQGMADARNFGILKASGDWIWHFDADFELENPNDVEKVKEIIQKESPDIISIFYRNLTIYGRNSFVERRMIHRKNKNLYWIKPVHENLILPKGIRIARSDVKIKHYGYFTQDILFEKTKGYLKYLSQNFKDCYDFVYLIKSLFILSFVDKNYINEFFKFHSRFIKVCNSTFLDFLYAVNLLVFNQKIEQAMLLLEMNKSFSGRFYYEFFRAIAEYESGQYDISRQRFLKCKKYPEEDIYIYPFSLLYDPLKIIDYYLQKLQ